MEILIKIAITYLLAYAVGSVFKKLKIPMGEILGALLTTVLLNLYTPYALFTSECKLLIQITLGASVGSGLSRSDVSHIREMIKPFILLISGLILLTLTAASIIYLNTDFDIPTALLASAPGGMSDMAMIAQSYDAAVNYVSSVHVIRALVVLVFSSSLYRGVYNFAISDKAPKFLSDLVIEKNLEKKHEKKEKTYSKYSSIKTFIIAAIGGYIFNALDVPAGGMIGAIVVTVAMNLKFEDSHLPKKAKQIARVGVGCYIGVLIKEEFIADLHTLIFPSIVVIIGITLFTVIMAIMMSKIFKIDLVTAMLMSMPGGITEISVIADDFGADQAKIMCVHSLRLICVITLFPHLITIMQWIYL